MYSLISNNIEYIRDVPPNSAEIYIFTPTTLTHFSIVDDKIKVPEWLIYKLSLLKLSIKDYHQHNNLFFLILNNGSIFKTTITESYLIFQYEPSYSYMKIDLNPDVLQEIKLLLNNNNYYSIKKLLYNYYNSYVINLEQKLHQAEKRIMELETHIKYMPYGEGYYEALENWQKQFKK